MNLTSSRDELLGRPATTFSVYKVHELPPLPRDLRATERCLTAGGMYNPGGRTAEEATGSQDSYAVGDLSGKHNKWRRPQTLPELFPRLWDVFLPLQGPHSVAHRTLVLYRPAANGSASQEPWMCGTLLWYEPGTDPRKVPVSTAEAVYRYPIVGRIVFRQPAERPWADTTVLVEYLVHADGTSQNNTFEHRWGVHDSPPGKDFYDWQNRCLSAGGVYNPHKVYVDRGAGEPGCDGTRPGLCPAGLLSARHGTFAIAGRKGNGSALTRRLYTDRQLALGGPAGVLGRSLVIYDDHGPKARGERLACSVVGGVYRRKAVAKDWFGNGQPTTLKGRVEMIQQTEHDVTDLDVKFEGLDDSGDYRIHKVSVEMDLEFPCEETAVYGTWDPLGVGPARLPEPGRGSTDQYPMGDLSGKFGTLEGSAIHASAHNDSRLPLFGTDAVIGRSVVVYKKNKVRWACSTIERGYSPSEARELRAIASFHHPLGFAYGFIRMTQLVYRDGSTSDTVIEVKLRHPGKHDRNVTRNHNWAIFVNPVGVDATVKVLNTRCVAGGYMWNPYYTQLADPLNEDLYRDECGPDNPLRCYVGDVSGRMGTIDIGTQRQVFTDSNFPLEGTVSALGRSIVIFTKDRGGERFACAKIEPDSDIIKYANIEKPPRFVLAQFMAEVREIMGIPEWMLSVDSRKTRTLHDGGCVQFLLHFKGPIANQLELDFSRLMNAGSLPAPTLYIPGYVPSDKRKKRLSYRPCGARDPNQKSRKKSFLGSRAHCNRWSSFSCYGLAVLSLNFYLWAGTVF
ncbi:uncharacterized protein LOC134536961 [Bacillus rossius redtenbacheri]|uniref:uncharacterized protein LOC134536961 n=1 Tax=Bacillus rossius redtenbacheri TaxID=93214 RepID=UPI002FDE368F